MKITLNNIDDVFRSKLCGVETMQLKGYELIEDIMVDSSGFGADNELAYTKNQFTVKLTELLKEHGTLTAKITNQGQFQVYVGLFKKTSQSKMQKIDNNTYKIRTDMGYKIRLHDTDIIEYKDDKIILNSGGFQTKTTKDRINKYLPSVYNLFQSDWTWYIHDIANEINTPFKDGMVLKK